MASQIPYYLLMNQPRRYQKSYLQLSVIEIFMDFKIIVNKKRACIEALLSALRMATNTPSRSVSQKPRFRLGLDAGSGLKNGDVIVN